MKAFFCFTLLVAAASASGIIGSIGGPIGVGGISPLGLGLAQQQLLVQQPIVSKIGLAPQVIGSPLALGGLGVGGLGVGGLGLGGLGLGGLGLGGIGLGGLGATKIVGTGLGLNGIGLGLGGLPLGGQIISPLNSGLLIKK